MMCWRCGSPDRFWKDCPLPFNASRPFGAKGNGKPSPVNMTQPRTVHFNTELQNDDAPIHGVDDQTADDLLPRHPPAQSEEGASVAQTQLDVGEEPDPWAAFYALRARGDWANFYSSLELSLCCRLFPTDLSPSSTKSLSLGKSPRASSRLPVLIDSGASGDLVGMSWLQSWLGRRDVTLSPSSRSFRFGGGGLIPGLGNRYVALYLHPVVANAKCPESITVTVGVVPSEVPLLI